VGLQKDQPTDPVLTLFPEGNRVDSGPTGLYGYEKNAEAHAHETHERASSISKTRVQLPIRSAKAPCHYILVIPFLVGIFLARDVISLRSSL
jgi:hypothetical protein